MGSHSFPRGRSWVQRFGSNGGGARDITPHKKAPGFLDFGLDEYLTVFTSYFHWPEAGQNLRKTFLNR